MGQVYTKRFYGGTPANGVAVASVPAGKVWVVRCITGCLESGTTAAAISFHIGGVAMFAGFNAPARTGIDIHTWEGRVALTAGQPIICANLVGPWEVTISGYEFDA